MREMKNSGIEWIGEIPVGWEVKKAKRIFKERNEKGNEISLQLLSPSQKYGVIPQSELDSVVKVKENTDLSTFKTIHAGDYCISLRSFQGGFEYSVYEGVVSPAYHVFYANIDINHLYYKFLFKCVGFIEKIASLPLTLRDGKNISFAMFGDIVIPIPPLKEQHRISTYLDTKCEKIDSIIARQQEVIEKLKAYKLSVITEAVTKGLNPDVRMKDSGVEWIGDVPEHWGITKLGNIFSYLGGFAYNSDLYTAESDYQVIRIGNVKNYRIVLENNPVYISESTAEETSKYKLKPGTILFTMTGTKGKRDYFFTHLLNNDDVAHKNLYLNQRVGCLMPIQNVCAGYYNYLLKDNRVLDSIFLYETGTANQGNLGIESIRRTRLQNPPIEEQQQIADYLDKKCSAIDSAIAKKQAIIDKLTAYKKSLIYEVVTGKREV